MVDLTKEQLLKLADRHITRFARLLDKAEDEPRGINVAECVHYYHLWQGIKATIPRGDILTVDQQLEVDEAMESGDYDDILQQ